MSEVRTLEKNEEVKVENTKTKASSKKSAGKKTVVEMKLELQKLVLDVRTGKENNTSLISKLKKDIARELTKLNMNK